MQVDQTGGFVTRGSVAEGGEGERKSSAGRQASTGGFVLGQSEEANKMEEHSDSLSKGDSGEDTPEGEEPNEYEKSKLRRVGENLPLSAFLIAIVELTERFTYYGCQGLFQNYISNSKNYPGPAKGLGLGHQAATGLNVFFQFFCYGMSCLLTASQSSTLICRSQLHPFLVLSLPINILESTKPSSSFAVSTGSVCLSFGQQRYPHPLRTALRLVAMLQLSLSLASAQAASSPTSHL